jgi:hypothetical protein
VPAKIRKPAPVRAIAQRYPTRSAQLAATAGDRYYFDIEGPKDSRGFYIFDEAQHGIRDRENPDRFDARPGMPKSALDAEIAQLNAGETVSPVSQGIYRRPRPLTPAVRWVEFLLNFDGTRKEIQKAIEDRRGVSLNEVHWWMTYRNKETGVEFSQIKMLQAPPATALEDMDTDQRLLIEAVAKQLKRVFGVRLDQRNDWRAVKRR